MNTPLVQRSPHPKDYQTLKCTPFEGVFPFEIKKDKVTVLFECMVAFDFAFNTNLERTFQFPLLIRNRVFNFNVIVEYSSAELATIDVAEQFLSANAKCWIKDPPVFFSYTKIKTSFSKINNNFVSKIIFSIKPTGFKSYYLLNLFDRTIRVKNINEPETHTLKIHELNNGKRTMESFYPKSAPKNKKPSTDLAKKPTSSKHQRKSTLVKSKRKHCKVDPPSTAVSSTTFCLGFQTLNWPLNPLATAPLPLSESSFTSFVWSPLSQNSFNYNDTTLHPLAESSFTNYLQPPLPQNPANYNCSTLFLSTESFSTHYAPIPLPQNPFNYNDTTLHPLAESSFANDTPIPLPQNPVNYKYPSLPLKESSFTDKARVTYTYPQCSSAHFFADEVSSYHTEDWLSSDLCSLNDL